MSITCYDPAHNGYTQGHDECKHLVPALSSAAPSLAGFKPRAMSEGEIHKCRAFFWYGVWEYLVLAIENRQIMH